jgi:hypothetical protein
MKSPILIERSIALNRDAVLPLLRAQLEALEEHSERGTVVLATRILGSGGIAVPVAVRVSYPAPRTPRFGFTVAARERPALYPQFHGTLDLAETGTAATRLTLSGAYHVPLGLLGAALDATVARGVAPSGLEDLLDRLVESLVGGVAQGADDAYRAGRRGG